MVDDALDAGAVDREGAGSASTSLSFSPAQTSDLEAATGYALADATDEVIDYETRSLGRDFLALAIVFLIAAAYHVQNPLLTYGTQFGRSWRNDNLQSFVGLALLGTSLALIWTIWRSDRPEDQARGPGKALRWIASIVLIGFCLIAGSGAVLKWNPVSALLGVTPEYMMEEVDETTPADQAAALQSALVVMTVFEYLAFASVVVLWRPWTRWTLYRRALRKQLAAIIVGVLVIVLWETLIVVLQIQEFLLPRPTVIAGTFFDTYPRLISAAWITFQNAFWGFVLGCSLGVATGIIAARFLGFSRALLPIAIAINAIPIIALAPIFNNWFGALNPFSKIAICAVLTYFPTMISTVRGLTTVDPLALELMRSYAASQFAVFRKTRLPNAMPYIFSALKVATTLATIGAVVSEYFGGSTAGLGFKIRDDAGLFRYPEAWAAILTASLFGILFYLVVSAVERSLLHWHVAFREK